MALPKYFFRKIKKTKQKIFTSFLTFLSLIFALSIIFGFIWSTVRVQALQNQTPKPQIEKNINLTKKIDDNFGSKFEKTLSINKAHNTAIGSTIIVTASASIGTASSSTGSGSTPTSGGAPTGGGELLGIEGLRIIGIDCLFGEKYGGQAGCSNGLIDNLIDFLIALSYPLAILVILWGGYQFFFGGIDGKTTGTRAIIGAFTGLILIFLAQILVKDNLITSIFDPSKGIVVNDNLTNFIKTIITFATTLAGIIAVLVIVWGGYKYFFAGLGIEKETGLKNIQYGVIGLFVVLLANIMVDFIYSFAGQISSAQNSGDIIATIQTTLIQPLLSSVTNLLFGVASLVAVLVITWGGYQYFFSGLDIVKKDGLENIKQGGIGLLVVLLAKPIVDFIQSLIPNENQVQQGQILNINVNNITNFLVWLISQVLIPIATFVSILFIILAGYYWITSNGDQGKIEKASKSATNSIIGLLIVLLASTIVQIIIYIIQA